MNFRKIREITAWLWSLLFVYAFSMHTKVYAFTKLKSGFDNITTSYLIPLAGAVAGASFILFVTLSFFKQEEYQKKVANVAILSIFVGAGLDIIKNLISNFS